MNNSNLQRSDSVLPTPAADTSPAKPRKRRWASVLVHTLVWGYLLLLIGAGMLIRRDGERWWFATLVLFGPRWIFGAPLVLLVPLVFLLRRRLIWIVAGSAIFFAFEILNLAIPWRAWSLPATGGQHLRLLTCNTHRYLLNAPALAHLIDNVKPDVVVLQEWESNQGRAIFHDPGWHVYLWGELLVASKYPIRDTLDVLPSNSGLEGAANAYDLMTPGGNIHLVNMHLASPHLVFSDALHRQPGAPDEIADNCLARRIESQLISVHAKSAKLPTLLAGDFNTPIDSETFGEYWTGLTDAFAFAGSGIGVTYRVKWTRTRIDHILFNSDWQCRHCWLGPDVGSPHLPVIADLELKP